MVSQICQPKTWVSLLMVAVLLVAICMSCFAFKAKAATPAVILYENINYGGRSTTLSLWQGNPNMTTLGWQVSSLKVLAGAKVTLYCRTNYSGGEMKCKLELYQGNYPDLRAFKLYKKYSTPLDGYTGGISAALGDTAGVVCDVAVEVASMATWNDAVQSAKCEPISFANDQISSFRVSNGYLDECVIVYVGYNCDPLSGEFTKFIASDRTLAGQAVGDNSVSSLEVRGDCLVRLYDYADYKGNYFEFRGPGKINNLGSYGWDNRASSILVADCDSSGVVMHIGTGQTEEAYTFFHDVSGLPSEDCNGRWCPNDKISSIQVVGGASVTAYYDSGFHTLMGTYSSISE